MEKTILEQVQVPNECNLRQKLLYEYITPNQIYDIELFLQQDGSCYAVGVPREGRLIVYGSPEMTDATQAIQIVISKIHKEAIELSGEVESPPFSE